jgi:hypothetical protein
MIPARCRDNLTCLTEVWLSRRNRVGAAQVASGPLERTRRDASSRDLHVLESETGMRSQQEPDRWPQPSLDTQLLELADEVEGHIALGAGPGASLAHRILACAATDLVDAIRKSLGLLTKE